VRVSSVCNLRFLSSMCRALEHGREDVVELLLTEGGVDPDQVSVRVRCESHEND
jgi:hypothetical protein